MQNGELAIKYFNQIKKNVITDKIKMQPQLIFLDLNMLIKGGQEFLDYFLEL